MELSHFEIFDSLLEPCFGIDQAGVIIYCNETAVSLLGTTRRKILNKDPIHKLIHLGNEASVFNDLSQVKTATPYREVMFTNLAGDTAKIQWSLQPLAATGCFLLFTRDVTLEERLQSKYRAELEQKETYIEELKSARNQLELYSKNLEKMVEERTTQIREMNSQLNALINSLDEGFLIFDKQGLCKAIYTKSCETLLECTPAGKEIWDVLQLRLDEVDAFKKWLQTLFSEMLPFEDLSPLGPDRYAHSGGREISLEYFPIRSEDGTIQDIVMVASDITELLTAQREAEMEKQYAKFVLHLMRNRRELSRFVLDLNGLIVSLKAMVQQDRIDIESLFRVLHTIKGGAASFAVHHLATCSHQAEDILDDYKRNPSTEGLDKIRNQAKLIEKSAEQFHQEIKSIIGSALSDEKVIELTYTKALQLLKEINQLKSVSEAQAYLIEAVLYEPIKNVFTSLDEQMQSLADELGKEIHKVDILNGDVRVDSETYRGVLNSLVHAFRNSMDHGIESPEERKALGKDPKGKMRLEFQLTGKEFIIKLTDDGRGIDPKKIRAKLESLGRSTAGMSDIEVIQQVFEPSFTTKETVSQLSGRGVGMDAIKAEVVALGGKVSIASSLGYGTQLTCRIPFVPRVETVIAKIAS
jgi:two-component system chemotaxis sensor kinase CheA